MKCKNVSIKTLGSMALSHTSLGTPLAPSWWGPANSAPTLIPSEIWPFGPRNWGLLHFSCWTGAPQSEPCYAIENPKAKNVFEWLVFCAAQRYGLVDAPPQQLTEDEWKKVKEKANLRQDFQQPCVICKEELGLHQHVSRCLLTGIQW